VAAATQLAIALLTAGPGGLGGPGRQPLRLLTRPGTPVRQNMTITRHASAGARRTWLRLAPRRLLGTAADPDAAPASALGA
jgi:hypothetical protein